MTMFDTYFLSHGSPMLALDAGAAGAFWHELGRSLPRPKAVLCISAHWNTLAPAVCGAAHPPTIHDFYGFPDPLYRITYPTPGAPVLATRVVELLAAAGVPCAIDPAYGLVHGAWVPLRSLYPDGIPVAQLSVQPYQNARWHCRLGRALAPLRDEGVFVVASGMSYHNLRAFGPDARPVSVAFDSWVRETVVKAPEERDRALVDWARAPSARQAHPREEHLIPLMVCVGAAGDDPGTVGYSSRFANVALSAYHYG
jgi:aromatic ring-opening dioxygenase catalytic subunit (LigB family)